MSPSIESSRSRRSVAKLVIAACVAAYFIAFNWGSLRVHFALDDLGNMGHYYGYSPWQLVLSNFLPWRGDSRPMGGLFYIPIHQFAGLNPVPYQAVLSILLLVNVYWSYRLVRLLGGSEIAAGLVALVCCYHGGIANLYYNAAFVFDVLCYFFYLASLIYYVGIRSRGQLLSARQTLVFMLLFLCALNSKEMAVSIPVMLLIYEWIYRGPSLGRVALLAGVLTAVDIYGKVSGAHAMIHAEGYHPVFRLERVRDFQAIAWQDLFFSWSWTPGWPQILALWVALGLAAGISRRPILRFLFWFLVVVPLPIEFLPGKRGGCLALLMFGGAAFAAVVLADAIAALARGATRIFRLSPMGRTVVAGMMVTAAIFFWVRAQYRLRVAIGGAPMTTLGFESWDLIEQLQASGFHPRPGSSAIFLNDPFLPHTADLYYLVELWLHDRSVTLHVPSQGELSREEVSKMDYIFTIEDRKVIRLK